MIVLLRRIMALSVVVAMLGSPTPSVAEAPNEAEASMNFELASVESFLLRVVKLVDGFHAKDATNLAKEISLLRVDSTLSRSFPVTYRSEKVNLRVEAFMDDIDAPDLYFFTTPALARQIDDELKKFAAAQEW